MADRLPAPPGTLPTLIAGDLHPVAAGTRLWRIYRHGGAYPTNWQEFRHYGFLSTARFDHHTAPRRVQTRGVMYLGIRHPADGRPALETCLTEAYQDTRTIDPRDRDPWVVTFALTRPLALLDLTSGWTTRAGGNQAICSGARGRAREWSRAIYSAYADIDGLFYAASTYGPGRAVVLFERAADAIPPHPVFHRPLNDPGLRVVLRNAAVPLGYGLV